MSLTSVLFLQVTLAQQNQTDFERKYSDLAGTLAENYNKEVEMKVYSDNANNKHNILWIAKVT